MFRLLRWLALGTTCSVLAGEVIEITTRDYTRRLEAQNGTWTTTQLSDRQRHQTVNLTSEEFGVRLQDGTLLTALDYQASTPLQTAQQYEIHYTRRPQKTYPTEAPLEVVVHFILKSTPNAPSATYTQKYLSLTLPGPVLLASLEVERFSTTAPENRGGRGEPIVLNQSWIFAPENPTMLTRHTDGNQPAAYSHHFEKVGNHSFVDFQGGDLDPHPTPGLVRCFHFPAQAQTINNAWHLESQRVDLLLTPPNQTPETYLIDTFRPTPRTFTHYNNWFDSNGKDLRGDKFPSLHRAFLQALGSSNIKLDAMVPDNGWQNRQSVWQPSANFFPGGMTDLAQLGHRLRDQGSSLGLWLALDGTTNDIGWGVKQGYTAAQANPYFRRYFAHYSLADPRYHAELTQQLGRLVAEAQVSYFKFDFNHLSHVVPTDRHGHEAEMDGFIRATHYAHEQGVFINATNWTWHSPAWLNYANSVWLLAGDDGFNANWPELSGRAQATTDRDVFFWRMWGQPEDRPWFPISSIMTHGIIRNPRGQMSFATDTLRDWSDHVLMHYGRGTLLREWYLTPHAMLPQEWQALIAIHQWTESRRQSLNHTCFVGGRPDEGEAYGYMGWSRDGTSGTLVARNPSPQSQQLIIPLTAATQFLGHAQQPWQAHQVYPENQTYSLEVNSEQALKITLPGYETIALEISPGTPPIETKHDVHPDVIVTAHPQPSVTDFTLTPTVNGRRELLVIGYPDLPNLKLNGQTLQATRQAKGKINQFPSYAKDGMPSKKARVWAMAGYDLSTQNTSQFQVELSGVDNATRAEAWIITENLTSEPEKVSTPSPLTFPSVHRQSTCLVSELNLKAVVAPKIPLTSDDLKHVQRAELKIEVFGINAGYGEKLLYLNHEKIAVLPTGGDQWKVFQVQLTAPQISQLQLHNLVEIQAPDNEDKFKVGKISLKLTLQDGRISQSQDASVFTSHLDWTYFEGKVFQVEADKKRRISPTLSLDF